MKSRPIMFSTPMVEALLRGTKTQTRRIIKTQPVESEFGKVLYKNRELTLNSLKNYCPYGEPGDELWVKETYQIIEGNRYIYKADPLIWSGKWKPSLFMPKTASRITLKITQVRVEKLFDISMLDADREGVFNIERDDPDSCCHNYTDYLNKYCCYDSPIDSFHSLWQSINGTKSWKTNPWLWVLNFEIIKQ
jgi:hypothetical protein